MPTSLSRYLDPTGLDETVVNIRQLTEALEAEMQELPYARPDGLYPDMTVGAVIGADETAQWATRESTGSGSAIVRSVQGAAVAWNQTTPTINNDNWYKNAGVTATFGSGTVRMAYVNDGTTTASSNRVEVRPEFYAGHGVYQHKYLILADITPSKDMQAQLFLFGRTEQGQGSGRTVLGVKRNVDANVTIRLADIITETNSDVYEVLMGVGMCGSESRPVLAGDYADVSNAMLFDLTTMFGSGNEPTTVAEFERMYPASYYPYSAPTLKPVQIAGIASTDANGNALDGVVWTAQTLRAAGTIRDELTAGELVTRVGVVDLGTLTWVRQDPEHTTTYRASLADKAIGMTNLKAVGFILTDMSTTAMPDLTYRGHQSNTNIYFRDDTYPTAADFKAAMNGVYLFYELATPTTQPISPALPMTYKVQQGGSESIIVPEGEISAAPVLTIAEPVNMSTELARIWEAIQSLGYTRNAAQLSRPVSLTDTVSIDETQKDTAEIAEIDTVKEVQE